MADVPLDARGHDPTFRWNSSTRSSPSVDIRARPSRRQLARAWSTAPRRCCWPAPSSTASAHGLDAPVPASSPPCQHGRRPDADAQCAGARPFARCCERAGLSDRTTSTCSRSTRRSPSWSRRPCAISTSTATRSTSTVAPWHLGHPIGGDGRDAHRHRARRARAHRRPVRPRHDVRRRWHGPGGHHRADLTPPAREAPALRERTGACRAGSPHADAVTSSLVPPAGEHGGDAAGSPRGWAARWPTCSTCRRA